MLMCEEEFGERSSVFDRQKTDNASDLRTVSERSWLRQLLSTFGDWDRKRALNNGLSIIQSKIFVICLSIFLNRIMDHHWSDASRPSEWSMCQQIRLSLVKKMDCRWMALSHHLNERWHIDNVAIGKNVSKICITIVRISKKINLKILSVKLVWTSNGSSWSNFALTWLTGFIIGHECSIINDDVIKWKHFPRYVPFVRGIHRSPVNSPYKGQWRGALMFSLICAWINGRVNSRKAGDWRRHRTHCDVILMRNWFTKIHSSGITLHSLYSDFQTWVMRYRTSIDK